MIRPMVETRGRVRACVWHQASRSAWTLAVPRLGSPVRRRRLAAPSAAGQGDGLRRLGARCQRRRVAAGLTQSGLPAIERTAPDGKGLAGGGEAVVVQEREDGESVLGMWIHAQQNA